MDKIETEPTSRVICQKNQIEAEFEYAHFPNIPQSSHLPKEPD